MRRAVIASVALVVLQFFVAMYLYPAMPERMAVHWGLSGDADGYGSRFMGLLLIPLVSALMLPLLSALPRLDPSGGIAGFREGYDWFVAGTMGYLSYVYGLTVAWNLGWRFDFGRMLSPAMGGLFYGIGVLMGSARMNWFVGIRTPWTLSSEEVWDATHEVGGRLFKVCGVLASAGVLTEEWLALALMVAPVMVSAVYLVYFSLREYQKLL